MVARVCVYAVCDGACVQCPTEYICSFFVAFSILLLHRELLLCTWCIGLYWQIVCKLCFDV